MLSRGFWFREKVNTFRGKKTSKYHCVTWRCLAKVPSGRSVFERFSLQLQSFGHLSTRASKNPSVDVDLDGVEEHYMVEENL